MPHSSIRLGLVVSVVTCWGYVTVAQNINVSSPVQTTSDNFYETIGTGFQFDSGSAQFGWQPNATPPFGGYAPNHDARFGLKAGPLSFNLLAAQGSRRSIVSQAPTLTLSNGGTGYFIDAEMRPFVTGFVPIVGGQPTVVYPDLRRRLKEARSLPASGKPQAAAPRRVERAEARISSAQSGDLSVAEIRRQRAAGKSDEVERLLAQARLAVAAEKWSLAENYLRRALRRAQGARRSAIANQLDQILARKKRPRQ